MKRTKPAFLKTFSECTIQELRAMPVKKVFSLFFAEVSDSLSFPPLPRKQRQIKQAKKNTEITAAPAVLTAKVKKQPAFSFRVPAVHPPHLKLTMPSLDAAVKWVFPSATMKKPKQTKKNRDKKEKLLKEETVVFQNPSAPN